MGRGIEEDSFYALKVCFPTMGGKAAKKRKTYLSLLQVLRRSQLKKIKLCEYDLNGNLLRYTGLQRFERECSILESLSHPNIICFHEVKSLNQSTTKGE